MSRSVMSRSVFQRSLSFRLLPAAALMGAGPAWGYVPNPADFATSVVSYNLNNENNTPYNTPAAVLGPPTVTFNDPYGNSSGDSKLYDNSKIIEPPYDTDHATGADVLTVIPQSTVTLTYSVTVQMGRPVTHDPNNPFGIDLIVYGNSFFTATGADPATNDNTNLTNFALGAVYGHPLIVSVSPDGVNWYTYPEVADTLPFQAYQWNDATQTSTGNLLNFNQPVNPAVAATALAGGYSTASQALDAYAGAAGGTGYSLAGTGFNSIDYVRVSSGTDGYAVVDAIAAVDPVAVPEPETTALLATAGLAGLLIRSGRRTNRLSP
jgi:hypothetical protein